MIIFLTLVYVAVLLLLVKLRILPWNTWTKVSPLVWMLLLLVILFIPLQFYAPSGSLVVLQPTVAIVPNVAGEVAEVTVGPLAPVKKGDVLFRIDPVPFQARVQELEASLEAARQEVPQLKAGLDAAVAGRVYGQAEVKRLQQAVKTNAVSRSELDRAVASLDRAVAEEERARLAYKSEIAGVNTTVAEVEAQLRRARYDLDSCTVRAAVDGVATNVEALRPGARVVNFPVQQAMAIVDSTKRFGMVQIQQIFLRHVQPGQPAECVFKLFPGKVFTATVVAVVPGIAEGQVLPTGQLQSGSSTSPGAFPVRLRFDDEEAARLFRAGSAGTAAIYTGKFELSYIIRKVMLRMEAWLNYVNPF